MMHESMQFSTPGLYVPGEILYNPYLKPRHAILFCHIETMEGSKGCLSENLYLSEIMNCTKQTISKMLSELEKFKYINIMHHKQRRIFTNPEYIKIYSNLVYVFNEYEISDDLYLNEILLKCMEEIMKKEGISL